MSDRGPATAHPAGDFDRLVWLMPLAFAAHIVEEYAGGFGTYVRAVLHGAAMPDGLFLLNNAIFMTVLVSVCAVSSRRRSRRAAVAVVVWASANLFWDFLLHLGVTVASGVYFPGLLTACLLYYPLSVVVLRSGLASGRLSVAPAVGACAAGLAILLLLIWGGLFHFRT